MDTNTLQQRRLDYWPEGEKNGVLDEPPLRIFVMGRNEWRAEKADVEVTGPVALTLFATTSAEDTDFTPKLVDLHPDGAAYNLCDGILRARYRVSLEKPELLPAGVTSNVFLKGAASGWRFLPVTSRASTAT